MKITVTGGKGGTGKSTVAVNLAVELSKKFKLVLADLDVEAPNDHILLSKKLQNIERVHIMHPLIDREKCLKCGLCVEVCEEHALFKMADGSPFLLPNLCSGCKTCLLACPLKAIKEGKKLVGNTYKTEIFFNGFGFELVTGVLKEGEEKAYPVVLAARERAINLNKEILIVDTSAGTGNTVAAAMEDSDLVIAVTEPTPLGLHDLKLILQLTEKMGYRKTIFLNRSTLGVKEEVKKIAIEHETKIIAEMPYSKEILHSYIEGVPITVKKPESKEAEIFRELAKKIIKKIDE